MFKTIRNNITILLIGFSSLASGQTLEMFDFSDCMSDCVGDSTRIDRFVHLGDVTEIGLTAYANCNGNLEGHIRLINDTLNLIYSPKVRRVVDEETGEVMDVIDIAMCNCIFKFNYSIKNLGAWDETRIKINGETLDEINRRIPVKETVEIELDSDSAWSYDGIFIVVEIPAQFPGGPEAFDQYISTNLVYPENAFGKQVSGKVFLEFVINQDGSIEDRSIKVLKGLDRLCNNEAVRLMKECPDWVPASIKGRPVRQKMVMPITFNL